MDILTLSVETLDALVAFEKKTRLTEPEIFLDDLDEVHFRSATLTALKNPHYSSARCLMSIDANKNVTGRLDFSILSSFAFGGDLRVYVDWVYVLKEHRHKGIAQSLFNKMEDYLTDIGINEYFLIAAENDEAQSFYRNLENATIEKQDILTRRGY